MKSYTQGRNYYGNKTKNTASANLVVGDEMANDEYRHLCSLRDWPFLEKLRTITTVASTQFYNLPYDTDQVKEINVKISNITYTPKLSPSKEHWDKLNLVTYNSDIPQWYFVYNGQIGLWPSPASGGNVMTLATKVRVIDLSIADVTSTTVASITSGANAIVVSGGMTSMMVGMFIRITYTAGASGTGDGVWYEIAGITSATALTLVRNYGGPTIAAATAACTIAQMPLLPETFHDTPWKYAISQYWATNKDTRATYFQNSYDRDVKDLLANWGAPTTDMVIDSGDETELVNPNLTIHIT